MITHGLHHTLAEIIHCWLLYGS